MKKILITSKSFNKQSHHLKKLTDIGLTVITTVPKTEEEYLSLIDEDVVGIICGTEKITANIIHKAKNLQVISRFGTGIDNICTSEAKKRNIPVLMTSTEPKEAVAELTISLILQMLRKQPTIGNNLEGKIVGIIGYGNIGKRVKELLVPFNVNVCIYDIDNASGQHFFLLDSVLMNADIMTLHIPLNNETYHLLNKENLNLLKDEAIIINTSRKDVIDESVLIQMLKEKRIKGFASDVSNKEEFVGLDNVIILPHIGSFTEESRDLMEARAVDYILQVVK